LPHRPSAACRPHASSRRLGSIDEYPECFIIRDTTGQALGHFYFEDEPGRRATAKRLTRDEAVWDNCLARTDD